MLRTYLRILNKGIGPSDLPLGTAINPLSKTSALIISLDYFN